MIQYSNRLTLDIRLSGVVGDVRLLRFLEFGAILSVYSLQVQPRAMANSKPHTKEPTIAAVITLRDAGSKEEGSYKAVL